MTSPLYEDIVPQFTVPDVVATAGLVRVFSEGGVMVSGKTDE